MQKEEVPEYILDRYPGVVAVDAWGERSLFYNPDESLPRGVYFATLKDKDGNNDTASMLSRKGVFRLNFGVSHPTYRNSLGEKPSRPSAGCVVNTGHDFTQLNVLLPHPIYAWMSWVCILNPDSAVFEKLTPLLDESYDLVLKKYAKRMKAKQTA